ncbi:MAG: menaquinone-dependent protoporphyrinogen IX dehydrogenase [Bifidobacteriaceae bacterium]|jgi:menaquinone-dependent protoporphyrinogen oxidase|nr:menaquinone-dependent protoporphyrinogen IX dehydrogenase [Bifidobacteriaceae bacterium]
MSNQPLAEPPSHRALIVYSSRFGQSEKIARAVAAVLSDRGIGADLEPLTRDTAVDPTRHGAFGLVASVRYGHFDKRARRLLVRHTAFLEASPSLLMTVSLTARTPEKRDPAVHVYTRKFLEQTAWRPTLTEVVAGALQYQRYRWFDAVMIRFIMRLTGGVTDPTADIEYTDWDQVSTAADRFAELVLAPPKPPTH